MATEMRERTGADAEVDGASDEWATKGDVEAVSTKVDALADTVDEQGAKIDSLTATVDEHSTKLDELTKTVDEHSTKLDALTETVRVLATNVDKLSREVEKIQVSLKWIAWILGGMTALMGASICTLIAVSLWL